MAAQDTETLSEVVAELQEIKKLIVVALMEKGMSQRNLADALGVNQSSISRMFTKRKPARSSGAKKSARKR